MYARILVPLDGTQHAEGALAHAVEIARRDEAEIILMRAAHDGLAAVPEARVHAPLRDVLADAIRGMRYLREVAGRLQKTGRKVRCSVLEGDTASAILSCAHRENVDVIVLEAGEHAEVPEAITGEVARKVATTTRRPVLVVKGWVPPGMKVAAAA